MADVKKNERVVQLLVELLKQPKKTFSVSDLLVKLNLSETERRNVQRDMNSLMDLPDKLVICEGRGPNKKYQTGLNVLDKLVLPNFEDVMLQFLFLQSVADMYPGTADLIHELQEKIRRNLPYSQREKLDAVNKELQSRVRFMGAPPKIDDNAGEKLHVILEAIRTHHEMCTYYKPIEGKAEKKNRLPIGIVLYLGAIYVVCVRHNSPGEIFAIKFNRIEKVEWTGNTFAVNKESMELLERRVDDMSLFNNGEFKSPSKFV